MRRANLKAGMIVRGDGMSRKHDMFVILHCRWVGGGSASSGTCISLCLNVCTCCLGVKCKRKSLAWGRENRVRAGKTEKSDAHADAAAPALTSAPNEVHIACVGVIVMKVMKGNYKIWSF